MWHFIKYLMLVLAGRSTWHLHNWMFFVFSAQARNFLVKFQARLEFVEAVKRKMPQRRYLETAAIPQVRTTLALYVFAAVLAACTCVDECCFDTNLTRVLADFALVNYNCSTAADAVVSTTAFRNVTSSRLAVQFYPVAGLYLTHFSVTR